jgi:type I restriction enzyme S subunit
MRIDILEKLLKLSNGIIPNGYTQTVVGLLPIEWRVRRIADVSLKITDGTHDTPQTIEKGMPYITAIHVKEGKIDFNNCYYVSEDVHKTIYQRCNPERDDLLVVNIGAGTGTTSLVKVDYEFSMKNVALIKPNKEIINPNYFEIVQLYNKERLFYKLVNGGAQPFLSLKEIGKLQLAVPNINEQEKIAEIISAWDKAIHLKEKLINAKKEQKRGLTKILLTGKKRLKGFDGEFKEVKLRDLFNRLTRRNTEGNTNVLTISAQQGLINQQDFFNKQVASEILDNYYLLQKGEFAYNKSYSKGYPMGAIKRLNEYDSGVVTTLYICFKLKEEYEQYSDYFEQYFESGLLNRGLTEIAQEGGRAHGLLNVSQTDFFNLKVLIPSEEEQCKISEILCCADKEISLLEKELQALKQQKKGLMQLLLTGIVRVNS